MSTRTRRTILAALALTIVFLGLAIMVSPDNTLNYLPRHNGLKPKGEINSVGISVVAGEDSQLSNADTEQFPGEDHPHPERDCESSEKRELMPSDMRDAISDSENIARSEMSEEQLAELRTRLFELFRQRIIASVSTEMYNLEEIFDYGLFAVAAGVVSNQQRDEDLHPQVRNTRSQIHYWIETNPGVHMRELQRDLGCSIGAVQYHLIQLEAQGIVRSHMNGKTKHLFAADFSSDEQTLQFTAMVRNPAINKILKNIVSNEVITQAELSRVLDVDVSIVSCYVGQLLDAKVVKIIPVFGREKPLMITDWANDCLVTHGLLV
ncbi:MAG: winged helix-turn-helix transcriptional regulator [Candidatus Thorarchaeota archaeon]